MGGHGISMNPKKEKRKKKKKRRDRKKSPKIHHEGWFEWQFTDGKIPTNWVS